MQSGASRQMTMQQYFRARRPAWPGHVAFALAAISFTAGDVLWLRIFAAGSCSWHLLFNYYHPVGRVLWLPIKWNAAFIAINVVWICELLRERYMPLTELERRVYDTFLADADGHGHIMTPLQCRKLLREAEYTEVLEGTAPVELLERGQLKGDVFLVVRGEPQIQISKRVFLKAKPGLFGEISFMSGSGANATVHVTPGCAYFRWNREDLKFFLKGEPEIARGLEFFMSREVSHKLFMMNEDRKRDQARHKLHQMKRITSRELAVLNQKRRPSEVVQTKTVKPYFRAGLWKLVSGGDRRRSEDWIYLDMWIGDDGTLFYWSEQQQAPLVYWGADDVANSSIRRTDDDCFHPHGFQVAPDDDFTGAPAEFAADSEELRERWIDSFAWSAQCGAEQCAD